jgi:hypothetical protein
MGLHLRPTLTSSSIGTKGLELVTAAAGDSPSQFKVWRSGSSRSMGENVPNAILFAPETGLLRAIKLQPREDIVQRLLRTHYVDPHARKQRNNRIEEAEANRIPIRGIEFGWECRDAVFSCEWEKRLDPLGITGLR